jgi:hypothetical protein
VRRAFMVSCCSVKCGSRHAKALAPALELPHRTRRFRLHLGIKHVPAYSAGFAKLFRGASCNYWAARARIQRSGMGKRGGGRVVYYVAVGRDTFYMMAAYPKSERDDLSTEQRRRILAALESIKKPGS